MSISLTQPTSMITVDAVNTILDQIGERPISDLNENSRPTVVTAQRILAETNLLVQSDHGEITLREGVKLSPQSGGKIKLPFNTINVYNRDIGNHLFVLDGVLHKREGGSQVFTDPLELDLTLGAAFNDLPVSVQWYITVWASLKFTSPRLPASPVIRLLKDELIKAKTSMWRATQNLRPGGMKHNNPFFKKMRGGRR